MRLKLLTLFPLVLTTGNALALGLGQMTVHSRLGSHFRAEVELVGASTEDQLTPSCFRLGQPIGPESGVPHLTRGHLRIDRQNGKLRLHISSTHAINDPVLQIRLHADCGAEVVRDYLLILDPIELTERQAASPMVAYGSNRDAPVVAGSSPSIPDTRRQSKSEKLAPPEPAKPKPERRSKLPQTKNSDAGRLSDRLSISGSILDEEAKPDGLTLRLATELSDLSAGKATESQRSILRLEYKVLMAIHTQASAQLSLAEQVRTLESSLAELRSVTESIASPAMQAQSRTATPPAPVVKEISTAQPGHRNSEKSSDKTDNTGWWIGVVGMAALLGAVVLMVWFLRRHTARATRPSLSLEPKASQADEAVLTVIPEEAPCEAGFEKVQVARNTPPPDKGKEFGQTQPIQAPAKEASAQATVLSEQSGFNPVMELADIMLAFGRIKGATEALLEYIELRPDEALQPWLKLLDIYRQNGMRSDYESLSQKLKLHFNVAPTDWEATPETPDIPPQLAEISSEKAATFATLLSRLPNIQQIAHVRDEIARTWGTPECRDYMNRLLRDNRNGERQRFSLSTGNELLFLLDILQERLDNTKSSG